MPLLIPGVNNDHAELNERQRTDRGWKGFIVTQPNCTATGMAITMKPVLDRFGIDRIVVTTMQALSGPGGPVACWGWTSLDNVVPYIPNEEQRVELESKKILGFLGEARWRPAAFRVSATCTRVNVMDGHTESVVLSTKRAASVQEVRQAMTTTPACCAR